MDTSGNGICFVFGDCFTDFGDKLGGMPFSYQLSEVTG